MRFSLNYIFLNYEINYYYVYRNSLAGSAICVYNMSAIEEVFVGPFKHQESTGSSWESKFVPHQSHTQCQNRLGYYHKILFIIFMKPPQILFLLTDLNPLSCQNTS